MKRNTFTMGRIASFLTIALAVSLLVTVPAGAHGGGLVRAIWDDADGFYMTIETNEDPAAGLLGGIVHVTSIPTPSADSKTTLRGMDINVSAVGPDGRTAGPVNAKLFPAGYEADLMVDREGIWDITIEVNSNGNVQSFEFPLDVAPRSIWTDIGIVGGLMMVPIFGIMGMVRMRRRRIEQKQGTARRTGGQGA